MSDLDAFVGATRRRLGRRALRVATRRATGPLLLAAGVVALARPLVWSLEGGTVGDRILRGALLAAGAACVGLGAVAVWAWRKRPDALASARAVDGALGLKEVVASGFAFARDHRADEMALFAIARATTAIRERDVRLVMTSPLAPREAKERKVLALGVAALVLGLALGMLDRTVILRALHPATSHEVLAAKALAHAAEQAASEHRDPPDERKRQEARMIEAARRAAEAARRGDRERAREALEEMRRAARALEDAERAQGRSLRALRDELEAKSAVRPGGEGDGAGRPSASASEASAKLAKELAGGPTSEAMKAMLERLSRAESAARAAAEAAARAEKSAGGKSGERSTSAAWSRVAQALKEAHEAAARGDAEAARRAMARAESELAAMEKGNASSEEMASLRAQAGDLDRSMYAAMSGAPSPGSPSSPGGDGPGSSEKPGGQPSKQASAGKGDATGMPGGGGPGGDRDGAEKRGLRVEGNLQARADVRAGERAVSAIQGMGRGGDPKAFAEIFPSYDTVVEDGLREDAVPAGRRPAVRRYFSSIRPGTAAEEDRK